MTPGLEPNAASSAMTLSPTISIFQLWVQFREELSRILQPRFRSGRTGRADTDGLDLLWRNPGYSTRLTDGAVQRFAGPAFEGMDFAKSNNVATARHGRRQHISFIAQNAASLGAAAVNSKIEGHRASSNTGSRIGCGSRGTCLYNAAKYLHSANGEARQAASPHERLRDASLGLNRIDLLIIALYLAGITLFGLRFRKRQRTMRDYFLADRDIPWWAISLSIVAAETSTLTIISIPGLAYDSNLTFLQVVMGYVVGRVIISFVLLPQYFRGDLYTAYQLIERRFGPELRTVTAGLFLLTQGGSGRRARLCGLDCGFHRSGHGRGRLDRDHHAADPDLYLRRRTGGGDLDRRGADVHLCRRNAGGAVHDSSSRSGRLELGARDCRRAAQVPESSIFFLQSPPHTGPI